MPVTERYLAPPGATNESDGNETAWVFKANNCGAEIRFTLRSEEKKEKRKKKARGVRQRRADRHGQADTYTLAL